MCCLSARKGECVFDRISTLLCLFLYLQDGDDQSAHLTELLNHTLQKLIFFLFFPEESHLIFFHSVEKAVYILSDILVPMGLVSLCFAVEVDIVLPSFFCNDNNRCKKRRRSRKTMDESICRTFRTVQIFKLFHLNFIRPLLDKLWPLCSRLMT